MTSRSGKVGRQPGQEARRHSSKGQLGISLEDAIEVIAHLLTLMKSRRRKESIMGP